MFIKAILINYIWWDEQKYKHISLKNISLGSLRDYVPLPYSGNLHFVFNDAE